MAIKDSSNETKTLEPAANETKSLAPAASDDTAEKAQPDAAPKDPKDDKVKVVLAHFYEHEGKDRKPGTPLALPPAEANHLIKNGRANPA